MVNDSTTSLLRAFAALMRRLLGPGSLYTSAARLIPGLSPGNRDEAAFQGVEGDLLAAKSSPRCSILSAAGDTRTHRIFGGLPGRVDRLGRNWRDLVPAIFGTAAWKPPFLPHGCGRTRLDLAKRMREGLPRASHGRRATTPARSMDARTGSRASHDGERRRAESPTARFASCFRPAFPLKGVWGVSPPSAHWHEATMAE